MKMKKLVQVGALLIALSALASEPQSAFAKRGKARKLVLRGTITAIDTVSVTVGTKQIALTSKTRYEDFFGGHTNLAAFHTGDCVKVQLLKAPPADTARKMELENNCPTVAQSTPAPTTTPTQHTESENESEHDGSHSGSHGSGHDGPGHH